MVAPSGVDSVIHFMANILPLEKQIRVVSALAEGQSIRAIERQTGIHQDTICRLGARVGLAGARIMDEQMRELTCDTIQMDEIWGFIGKKQKNLRPGEERQGLGDVWTFVSICADTRMVPNYLVGKRDLYSATCFVEDLASRLNAGRVQISTDGLNAYLNAVERGFGSEADYAQIVKNYGQEDIEGQRRYSPPKIIYVTKTVISGEPDRKKISTSYVERQNLTMRMHMRRLTRLTNAFSKKLDNFKAAVGLHFAYYNFVRIHRSLRMTPAMAGDVTDHVWSVKDLVEAGQ
jgi:IS1 family transposase